MDWLVHHLASKVPEIKDLAIQLSFVFAVSVGFVMLTRGLRRTRIRTVVRVLMSPKIWLNRSALLDYQYVALNMLVFPLMLGMVILGTNELGSYLAGLLPPTPEHTGTLSPWAAHALMMVALFLALEFAYWFDHYLSHKVPLLWEFHRVHHSAEVLTPFTNFRVHPVDSLFFYNIKSIIVALVYAGMIYAMGTGPIPMPEATLVIVYMWLYGHLQHSQLWIAFPGWWGKIFFSPAHHQIHHSKAKIHHNTNFGMSLSIFDWAFGTLHVPTKEKQQLEFGVGPGVEHHHLADSLIDPLVRAGRRLLGKKPGKRKAAEAVPAEVAAPAMNEASAA